MSGRLTDDLTAVERDGLQQAADGTMMHSHGRKGRNIWNENYGRLADRALVRPSSRTRDYQAYTLTPAGREALRSLALTPAAAARQED